MSAAGALWEPLLLTLPFLFLAIAALVFDAGLGGARAAFQGSPTGRRRLRLRASTAMLYLLQPVARLYGRLMQGLTPWRRRGPRGFKLPMPHAVALWSEEWEPAEQRLREISQALRERGVVVLSGGDWDRWDLHVRGGSLGGARLRAAIEEHGAGRQLVRIWRWPHLPRAGVLLGLLPAALALGAVLTGAWNAAATFGALTLLVVARIVYECGAAGAMIDRVLAGRDEVRPPSVQALQPLEED
jgi:hypothetical protein